MDVRHMRVKMPSWVTSATAVCFVIGGLLALQFTTQRKAGIPGRYGRADLLAQMLASSQNESEKQKEEINKLRGQLSEYREASTKRQELLSLVNKELTDSQIALGLVEVKGPGVEITIDDSTLAGQAVEDKEPFLLHDYDLWPLVNELRSAGAEAMAINGQRIVGSTAIRCVGAVLNINEAPVASPFTIKAIGDPAALSGALTIPGGAVERLQAYKFPVKLKTVKELKIEALGVAPKFRYSQPVALEK